MSVTIRIPTQLRELSAGNAEVSGEAGTLATVLDGLNTEVLDRATVSIVPAVAGG